MLDKQISKEAWKVHETIIQIAEWDAAAQCHRIKLRLYDLGNRETNKFHTLVHTKLIPLGHLVKATEGGKILLPNTEENKIQFMEFPHRNFSLFYVSEEFMSYQDDKDGFVSNYQRLMKKRWYQPMKEFFNSKLGLTIVGAIFGGFFGLSGVYLNHSLSCDECESQLRPIEYNECLQGPTISCAGVVPRSPTH